MTRSSVPISCFCCCCLRWLSSSRQNFTNSLPFTLNSAFPVDSILLLESLRRPSLVSSAPQGSSTLRTSLGQSSALEPAVKLVACAAQGRHAAAAPTPTCALGSPLNRANVFLNVQRGAAHFGSTVWWKRQEAFALIRRFSTASVNAGRLGSQENPTVRRASASLGRLLIFYVRQHQRARLLSINNFTKRVRAHTHKHTKSP